MKTFIFSIAGKLEAENESEATDLLYELLEGKVKFEIGSLDEGIDEEMELKADLKRKEG